MIILTILHIIDVMDTQSNGVAIAVKNYVEYESRFENVAMFCLNSKPKTSSKLYSYKDYKTIEELPEPFNKPDLVVFNEVYKPKYIRLYKECLKRNIKYIIIPHGCLVKGAQKKHRFKKIAGNILLFNRFIRNANGVQFLNESEKKNTHFHIKKDIIAGNGITPSAYRNNNDGDNKDLVYIGRYEVKHKGLDLLVKVCAENKKWFQTNDIKIQLYGRDNKEEIIRLNELVACHNVKDIIIINKPVYGIEKEQILKKAYAFIQCSRYEGQPMGIIEALSAGVPCVVTYGTYMGEYIRDNKCGIACHFDAKEVFEAIFKMTDDNQTRNLFAKNSYVKSNKDFEWNDVVLKTIEKYKKIIKGD